MQDGRAFEDRFAAERKHRALAVATRAGEHQPHVLRRGELLQAFRSVYGVSCESAPGVVDSTPNCTLTVYTVLGSVFFGAGFTGVEGWVFVPPVLVEPGLLFSTLVELELVEGDDTEEVPRSWRSPSKPTAARAAG